jgi:hypothetical protein
VTTFRNPYPGVDPFVESQGFWRDFHIRLLGECRDALLNLLPQDYDARIDEFEYAISPHQSDDPSVERRRFIRVSTHPSREPVTILCFRDATSTTSDGFLRQRSTWLRQGLHIVEIDLLLCGDRTPLVQVPAEADFFVYVTYEKTCAVFVWKLGDRIPVVRVPLRSPDPDVALDLGEAYRSTYEHGRYRRVINYNQVPHEGLSIELQTWARNRVRQLGL